MQTQTAPPAGSSPWLRYLPLAVWVGAVLIGILIPLKILQLGYIPADDAMRHVAKAISGKTWPEILVVEPGYGDDEHPGWHAILGAAHRWMNWDADQLIFFSVFAPFAALWLVYLLGRKRPEAMLVVLFFASVAAPATFVRPLFGRPFIFIMIVYVLLLKMWTRREKISAAAMTATVGMIGFSVWVHGSWYLFGIVIAGFALVGEWRKMFTLTGCWLAGVALGATFTGHPAGYLRETTAHLFDVFGGQMLERMLVTELQSGAGDLALVTGIGLLLLWRVARGEWRRDVVFNPLFAVAALGWLLGLKVSRFWLDWGFPAAVLWLAVELEAVLEARLPREKVSAALLAAFAGLGVYIATTRDIAGRWTNDLTVEYLDANNPDLAGWLPDPGGTIYSANMQIFFRTFYKNPHANWRYLTGFEPGIMPKEDLATLRNIQWNWFALKAYAPWLKKMRPEDRLIILQGSQPNINGLEWYYGATETWIGRLPRKNAAAKP